MTAGLEQTWSTAEVADMLDVGRGYVQGWVAAQPRRLTAVDVMVLRAVMVITGGKRGGRLRTAHHVRRATEAILADPRRWLAMTASGACTFDQPAESLPWWEARSRAGGRCLRLIDLQPDQVPV